MKIGGKYSIPQSQPQDEKGLVQKNKLGIKTQEELNEKETLLLLQSTEIWLKTYDQTHIFSAGNIKSMHKLWLGSLYSWAGKYRNVNISKDDFIFSAAHLIPQLMLTFQDEILTRYTPCKFDDSDKNAFALAATHVEFILIHPFMDGNGRIARALATLMAIQAGLPLLNFASIIGKNQNNYIAAIHAGLNKNYEPMQAIFAHIIDDSL